SRGAKRRGDLPKMPVKVLLFTGIRLRLPQPLRPFAMTVLLVCTIPQFSVMNQKSGTNAETALVPHGS
ncbi:MAG: hypothetical protein IKW76_02920, partial [Clostridia bacterium]|nr:hypothetical protein [Clostridia bacterium]